MLDVQNLQAFYGESHILHGVSLRVAAGEIAVLLGRNGMGKTTTLRSIMGMVPRTDGELRLDGENLRRLPCDERARRGITLVPEDRRIFANLTVEENLQLAASVAARTKTSDLRHVLDLFPVLAQRLRQRGGTLSGGEQQMLAMARALVCGPRVMLVDEPTEGLAPGLVRTIRDCLEESRRQGIAVLLVEQNSAFALNLADRSYVIQRGRIVHESADPLGERRVIEGYLAVGEAAESGQTACS